MYPFISGRLRIAPVLLLLSLIAGGSAAEQKRLDYGRDVRPILAENCFHCHGQDSKKRMAGLRLDSFEGATAKRGARVALVPGDPNASEIFRRATAEPQRRMPPLSSNRTLTPDQIAILERWISEGGQYSSHWAFVPPKRPEVPSIDSRWIRQPIDAFVLSRLQQEGLKPNPPADPAAWLRRASFDLTGLPPAPSDIEKFREGVKARGELAYSDAVDRLLASPGYGERMAMDWLDVARYADTHGFNNDSARSMWRWRDWVIDSFNRNMPYDRFITEQLAGDLLPNPALDQLIATGFGRNHVINSEGGIIDEEYRIEYVADRVRTLGMAWLGLTIECARCHDHKYDPITQRDHYRFFAFFNNVPEYGEDGRVTNAAPTIAAPTAPQQKRLQQLESDIAKLTEKIDKREASWKWNKRRTKDVLHAAQSATPPKDAVMQLSCESVEEFEKPSENASALAVGLAGRACAPGENDAKPRTGRAVPVAKRKPLTFAGWINPAANDQDAALFSAADYSISKASTGYGKGIDFRLAGTELEFRFADRFPAYSIRVRSRGAALAAEQWRHVAVSYEGSADEKAQVADASLVRMFVDGREVETQVLDEGIGLQAGKNDKEVQTFFRIGWDNAPGSARFRGRLDEVAFWTRALTELEIDAVFESRALPYAVAQQKASALETDWIRDAALRRKDAEFARDEDTLNTLERERFSIIRNAPTLMVMQELPRSRETHVLLRGAYNAPGERVEPGVPEELLGSWPEGAPKNRLGLAQWLTSPDHPLTARVVVNRFWQQLFSTGIVKTSDNFGLQGEFPSHPELLDWLAREFIASGWNVKALMKLMVLSATYRQDSAASTEAFARDPDNRLLARGPRFRLPAEVIRDQALFVAGLLQEHVGGPSVFPYQPKDLYKGIVVAADYPGTTYTESNGTDLYRRSLYTFWKRTVPHPTMTVFDAPDREFCIVRRSSTNTPLQALTLLNDPIFVEAARKLAERSIREGGATAESRLKFAFLNATGRAPRQDEEQVLLKTLNKMLKAYGSDEKGAQALLATGASDYDHSISPAELAAYTAVANMILNLDEVVTRG